LQIASEIPHPRRPPPRAPPPVESPISQFFDPPLSPCSAATPEIRPPAVAPRSAPDPIDNALHVVRSIEAQPVHVTMPARTTAAAASLSMPPSNQVGAEIRPHLCIQLRASCIDGRSVTLNAAICPVRSGPGVSEMSHPHAPMADGLPQDVGLVRPTEADGPPMPMGEADPAEPEGVVGSGRPSMRGCPGRSQFRLARAS
jgi:hypothetical protein